MGKKYIVEIGRLERLYKASVSENGKPNMTWLSPEVDLKPYTEPDIEKAREEAYAQGYSKGFTNAKVQCNIQAEKDLREVGERHYQKGLSDAWDAARWLSKTNAGVNFKVFGAHFTNEIVQKMSASECIEKIRQYVQEKDRQARNEYNFDEVKDVLETTAKECNISLDEIAEVLRKMREGQEQ